MTPWFSNLLNKYKYVDHSLNLLPSDRGLRFKIGDGSVCLRDDRKGVAADSRGSFLLLHRSLECSFWVFLSASIDTTVPRSVSPLRPQTLHSLDRTQCLVPGVKGPGTGGVYLADWGQEIRWTFLS